MGRYGLSLEDLESSASESESDSEPEVSEDEQDSVIKPKNFDRQIVIVLEKDNVSANHGVRLHKKHEHYSALWEWFDYGQMALSMGFPIQLMQVLQPNRIGAAAVRPPRFGGPGRSGRR